MTDQGKVEMRSTSHQLRLGLALLIALIGSSRLFSEDKPRQEGAAKTPVRDASSEAKPPVPKGPVVVAPINSEYDTAAKLERAAQKCSAAAEALALYQVFLESPQISVDEKKLAELRLGFWKDGAKKKLVRVGAKWVELAEKENLRHQARQLVKNAWDLVGIGNDDAAHKSSSSPVAPILMQSRRTLHLAC